MRLAWWSLAAGLALAFGAGFLFSWVPDREPARGIHWLAQEALDAEASRALPDPVGPPRLTDEGPLETRTPERRNAAAPIESVPVHGRLVVVEPDGEESLRLDGTLLLDVRDGEREALVEVPVDAGRWSTRLRKGPNGFLPSELDFHAFRIEGEGSVFEAEPRTIHAIGEDEVVIRLQRLAPFLLHVEDADTGEPLDGVTAFVLEGYSFPPRRHPVQIASAPRLEDVPSPLELDPVSSDDTLAVDVVVGAPGHAWTRVATIPRGGGEHLIRLERGGALDVSILGEPPEGTLLRIERQDDPDQPLLEVAVGEHLFLDGLPCVPLRAVLRVRGRPDGSAELESRVVELFPGETTPLELRVGARPGVVLAGLSGTVRLPPGWDRERIRLELELEQTVPIDGSAGKHTLLLGEAQRVAWSESSYAFALDGIQAGRYELSLPDIGYVRSVVVPPEGVHDLAIVVPEPVPIRVTLVDGASGDELWIRWLTIEQDREDATWRFVASPDRDDEDERTARVFPGPNRFTAMWDFATHIETVDITEAGQEVVLVTRPLCRVVFTLECGGESVPWPGGRVPLVSLQDRPEVRSMVWWSSKGEFGFAAEDEGPYVLTLPDLPGFEPHEPVVVHPTPGQDLTLDIQLVKIR